MSDVSVVVVSHNGLPWLEPALDSVRWHETVLVDHGSSDGTVQFVRDRYPDVAVVEEENRGLAFGWNTGVERTSGRYVLLLNSDAWLDDGALDALVAFADAQPRAAVVGPRLRYPDGRLQRSVRAMPLFQPCASPRLGSSTRATSGKRVRTISRVPSVEPWSTTTVSTPRTLSRQCSSQGSAL